MSAHKTFKFDPGAWLNNRALRLCSPAARGFWVDVMCLCHPSGYLVAAGNPMSDKQVAALVGESPARVRGWFAELGAAGVFDVDGDRLVVPGMVKAPKKDKPPAKTQKPIQQVPDGFIKEKPEPELPPPVELPPVVVTPKRVKDWWETPNGWAQKGNSQAIGMKPGESLEAFQVRLSVKLPPGPHLESLSDYQRAQVEKLTPKAP